MFGKSVGYPQHAGYYPPPPYTNGPAYPAYPVVQYYLIRSRLNGLVLDIEGGSSAPGARVILWNQKSGDSDNQLWYDDPATGTIRSKLNDYVLDIGVDGIVVNPYHAGNSNQHWDRNNLNIRNRRNPRKVFDISGANRNPGARVIAFDAHGGVNQQFDFQFVTSAVSAPVYPPAFSTPVYPSVVPPQPRPLFFIVSEMNCKVLDIEGDNPCSGANVVTWPRKHGRPANQLWYFDGEGVIRSSLNDFAMEAQTDCANIRMMPYTGSPHQRWTFAGNRIMKNQFECIDIAGENKKDGAKIISFRYKGSANQHWRLEYV